MFYPGYFIIFFGACRCRAIEISKIKSISKTVKNKELIMTQKRDEETAGLIKLDCVFESLINSEDKVLNLQTVDRSFLHLYKKLLILSNSGESIFFKKVSVFDYLLFNLIYKKEKLIEEKGDVLTIQHHSKLIDKYIDFPRLISSQHCLPLDYLSEGVNRLVVLVTHSCQLRCEYCRVKKYKAEMDEKVLKKAISLLFTSKKENIELQFFGGEPLLRFDLVKKGVKHAQELSEKNKKNIKFILTTNGLALTKDKIGYFEKHDFTLELSLDGDMNTQIKNRKSVSGLNYFKKLLVNIELLKKSKINFYIITVTMPDNVNDLFNNFKYIWGKGIRKIQINYALGVFWNKDRIKSLFKELNKINKFLAGFKEEFVFINSMKNRREPVILNAEITVDCNGDLFLETGICLEEDFNKLKKDFYLGDIKTINNINEIYNTRSRNLKKLVDVYSREKEEFRKIIINNIELGFMFNKFFKSLRKGALNRAL